MNEIAVGIVILTFMLGLFLTGIELAYGMAIMGFIGYTILVSFGAAMNLLAKDFFDYFIILWAHCHSSFCLNGSDNLQCRDCRTIIRYGL